MEADKHIEVHTLRAAKLQFLKRYKSEAPNGSQLEEIKSMYAAASSRESQGTYDTDHVQNLLCFNHVYGYPDVLFLYASNNSSNHASSSETGGRR